MTCGVYLIRNTVNGKVYVGSSIDIGKRWRQHINGLNAGRHRSPHLQSAWDCYGEISFEFSILEICGIPELLSREQSHIDEQRSSDREFGYNTCIVAGNSLGVKRSPETKAKLSKIHKGRVWDRDVVERRAASMRGQKRGPMTEERKESLRAARKGVRLSDEHKANIRANAARGERNPMFGRCGTLHPQYGKPCSLETRKKIGDKRRGIPKTKSHRMNLAKVNAKFTAEQISQMHEMRRNGHLNREIGDAFQCSASHVSNILHGKVLAYETEVA